MASLTPKFIGRYNARSISLPTRSHPTFIRIEDELNKLTLVVYSSTSNSKSIPTNLLSLTELYKSMEDLFGLLEVQQALAQHHLNNKQMVNELLECSLKYLDVCNNARDVIIVMKESVRELQSALRRKKGGELSIESYVSAYFVSKKNTKKEISKCINALKEVVKMFDRTTLVLDLTHILSSAVVRTVREASLITGSIFRSLFVFLSEPSMKPKTTKWSVVLKLINKGSSMSSSSEGIEDISMNVIESVDVALCKLLVQNASEDVEVERIESALKALEDMHVVFEDLEKGLECLFRHMIQARVSLLNIFSI